MSNQYNSAYAIVHVIRGISVASVLVGMGLGVFQNSLFLVVLYAFGAFVASLPALGLATLIEMSIRNAEKSDKVIELLEAQNKMLLALGRRFTGSQSEISTTPR